MTPAERIQAEALAAGIDLNLPALRALAPGFAAAVERVGLRAATDARVPYALRNPRLESLLREADRREGEAPE